MLHAPAEADRSSKDAAARGERRIVDSIPTPSRRMEMSESDNHSFVIVGLNIVLSLLRMGSG